MEKINQHEQPDPSKPLSRWNATYWAMMYGIAAKLSPAEWSVLCAIYCHLPNVRPGSGRIEAISGASPSSVKRARKRLKEAGLIDYQDNQSGGARQATTQYLVADVRSDAVVKQVLERLTGSMMNPVQSVSATGSIVNPVQGEPPTGSMVNPHGGHDEPPTGSTMNPEVRNRTAQARSQAKSEEPADAGAAVAATVRSASGSPPAGASLGAAEETTSPQEFQSAGKNHVETKPATKKPRKASAPLAPENVSCIVASYDSMVAYLLYGMPGVDEPDPQKRKLLPPSSLNFRQFRKNPDQPQFTEEEMGVGQWTANHFAGYFWFLVSHWRKERGLVQSLPVWGRVVGNTNTALKQMTKWQLVNYIATLTMHFDLLCCEIGRITENMTLDETVLTHSLFRNAANHYLSLPEYEQEALYENYGSAIEARKSRYARAA